MIAPVRLHPRDISEVVLGDHHATIEELVAVARYGAKVSFSPQYRNRVNESRAYVEKFLAENRIVYGVTTGFGSNVTKVISRDDAETLQHNLIRSHAVSVGEPLETEVVRATQFMILVALGHGYSGVRLEVLEAIAALLNHQVTPFAPGEGSVGYLAPEAHMALVLIGEGQAWVDGALMSGADALKKVGLRPIQLSFKEGLALITGTTSVTALAALALYNAEQATKTADIAGAMSFEALKGTIRAFDQRLHSLKKHEEQMKTAAYLLHMLEGSEIIDKYKDYRLQDALSLRCIPQVHGAVKKVLKDAKENVLNEIASVSDNPVVYPQPDDGIALMGGNFDASYVGMSADAMCIAMANLAKMSERRIDRLVNSHVSELPDFLIANPGLNSGYMIPQYTAAALLAEMKVLSHPSTVDNIPTCAYQEDVVSLAYGAARKAYQISNKIEHILAIELMTATQALEFHRPLKASPVTGKVCELIRNQVPMLTEDRFLYPDMMTIKRQIHEGEIVKVVEELLGHMDF